MDTRETTRGVSGDVAGLNGHGAREESDRAAVEAERSYLAIMLEYASRTDPKDFLSVVEAVEENDILRPSNREIFDSITCLWSDDPSLVGPDAVWQELVRRAREADPPAAVAFGIDGPLALVRMLGVTPTVTEAWHFAGLIREHAQHRREQEVVDDLAREMAGKRRPEVLAELNARLGEILAGRLREGGRLAAVAASTMAMRAAKWLYRLRIPAGGITLLAGREGIGKTTIVFDIVAKTTRGELEGRYFGIPRGVGIVATEDAWAEVVVPRLVAAGADLTRVFRIEAKDSSGADDSINVPADLVELARLCALHDIALLVLDPVMSVIEGSIDTHKDREVRKALDPLSAFAAKATIAVLALIHANKNTSADPLNSIMGSKAFTAVARSVLYCLADPDAEEGRESYLFCHPKSNLGPKQASVRYHLIEVKIELDPATVEPGDDPVVTTSRVVWGDDDERSAQDVMDASRAPRPQGSLTIRILEFLRNRGELVRSAEIAEEFPDVTRGTLDKHLKRMVDRGEIARPVYGHYTALPKPERGGGP